MNIDKLFKTIFIGLAVLTLASCAHNNSNRAIDDEPEVLGFNEYKDELEMNQVGIGDKKEFFGADVSEDLEEQLLSKPVIYFDYDRSTVSRDYLRNIYAHAKYLIENPGAKLRLEGHTDERGSRGYNIALGERRANAVAKILFLKGVPKRQVTVVSFGKEKPASFIHDESGYSLNRRTEFQYEAS